MSLRRLLFAIAMLAAAILVAPAAGADLDPARANAEATEAIAAQHAYCEHPQTPLPESALPLCEYDSVPDCQAFKDACDEALHRTPPSPWLSKIFGPIGKALDRIFNGFSAVALWILAGVVAILILYPILQSLAEGRRVPGPSPLDPLGPQGPNKMRNAPELASLSKEDDPERLLLEADQLVREKELDRALYRYLHAALLALDKRGAVRIAKGTTHGEYVRACSDAEARPPLRDLVREIDSVRFGGREPSEGGVSVARERATWIVRHAAALATVLVLFFGVLGCGKTPSLSIGDPSGNDVLFAVMKKQGVKVTRVPTSLAHLKLPTAETKHETPALFIDVDRVPLSEEAQSHVVTWTEAGGTLVLVGSPARWPAELKAKRGKSVSTDISVKTYPVGDRGAVNDDDDGEEHETPESTARIDHGKLARPAAVEWPDPHTFVVATTSDDKDYAVGQMKGRGIVYGVASDDLFTNVGMSIPGNAAAAIAILSFAPSSSFMYASPEDGFTPPTNPFAALLNAGLGLPLGHAIMAGIVLFFAVGVRFGRPKPDAPPGRRAFVEHVTATAAVYGRSRAAKHALAAFSRFAEARLSKRLGRGAPDIVSLLAQRSGERMEECAFVWGRGLAAREFEFDKANGDEIDILRRLSLLYAKTMRSI